MVVNRSDQIDIPQMEKSHLTHDGLTARDHWDIWLQTAVMALISRHLNASGLRPLVKTRHTACLPKILQATDPLMCRHDLHGPCFFEINDLAD